MLDKTNLYGSPLHHALREVVVELAPQLSPSTLDRAVADTGSESVEPAQAAIDLLSQCGLSAKVVTTDPCAGLLRNSVVLGVGSEELRVLVRGARGKVVAIHIDAEDGTETRSYHRRRKFGRRIANESTDTIWLTVTRLGGLATLAKPGGSVAPWPRLWSLVRLERADVTVTALYAASVGALMLIAPIATQALVNTIAFGTVMQPLIALTLALFIGLSLAGALSVLQAYIVEVMQRRIMVRVAEDFGERLPRVSASARDRMDLVELNNRFFDVVTVQKASAALLLGGLSLLLQITVGMVLLGLYHPVLLAFDLVLLACLFAVTQVGRGATSSAIAESKAKFAIAAWLDEIARAPRQFAGAHGRVVAAEKLSHRVRGYVRARRIHFRRVFSVLVSGVALQVFAVVALLGLGGWLVINRQLTLGQLVAAEIVVGAIAIGAGKLGNLAEKTFDLVAAVDKIGSVLDLPQDPPGSDPLPSGDDGVRVRARGLVVGYARGPASEPVDLELAPGDKRLIDGAAASGRSALLEVLAGWRRPTQGQVRWDGHSRPRVDDMAASTLLVRRDTVFAGSVFANLRLGDAALSTADAWRVLARVGLGQAIDALPDGLDTTLTRTGTPLSSSQLRRLALARALVAKPRLLLIDEALDFLSADDDEVARLCELFLSADAPWTALVISNDPRVRASLDGAVTVPARISTEEVRHEPLT